MMLRRGLQKVASLGNRVFRRPLFSLDSFIGKGKAGIFDRGLLLNKDEKDKDDDDDVDEHFRNKTFKEQFNDFWKDPKKKWGFFIALALFGGYIVTSQKLKDILGIDFWLYKRITLSVLEVYSGI